MAHVSLASAFVFQRAANMIPAHDSPLAALAFDASGTKLATASEKVNSYFTAACVAHFFLLLLLLFSSFLHLSLPLREQSFASSPSQRDRSSLSFGEESRGRTFAESSFL